MQNNYTGFLLDDAGGQVALNGSFASYSVNLAAGRDAINYAITCRGFVLMQPAHRMVFVELCPSKVAPLAALEAYYKIKETTAEYVVLAYTCDIWRSSPYEFFTNIEEALERMGRVARAASKRAAAALQALYLGSALPKIERQPMFPDVMSPG